MAVPAQSGIVTVFLRRETCSRHSLAPVAQLDRVLPSEGRGRTFESSRARQLLPSAWPISQPQESPNRPCADSDFWIVFGHIAFEAATVVA